MSISYANIKPCEMHQCRNCLVIIKEQKLPKYKRFHESTDNKYIDGWNACLDEITKSK